MAQRMIVLSEMQLTAVFDRWNEDYLKDRSAFSEITGDRSCAEAQTAHLIYLADQIDQGK